VDGKNCGLTGSSTWTPKSVRSRGAPVPRSLSTPTLARMNSSALEQAVLAWFAKHTLYEELATQCLSARVLGREHVGSGLIIQVAASAPNLRPVRARVAPRGPVISSPALPHGASVTLMLERGYISEIEIVALGGAAFPAAAFEFMLVDESH
jgi:hypothetical protein